MIQNFVQKILKGKEGIMSKVVTKSKSIMREQVLVYSVRLDKAEPELLIPLPTLLNNLRIMRCKF